MDAAIAEQDIAGLLVKRLRPKGVCRNQSGDASANLRRFAMLVVLTHDVTVSGGVHAEWKRAVASPPPSKNRT